MNATFSKNLPNLLTLSRLFLSLVFVALLFQKGFLPKISALTIFILACVTDYWDGRLARESGAVTPLGRLLDPIADKMLTLSAFAGLAALGIISWWMAAAVLLRDVAVTGFRLAMRHGSAGQEPRASGKTKTAFQMASISMAYLFVALRETAVWPCEWNAPVSDALYLLLLGVVGMTLWTGFSFMAKSSVSGR